MAIKPKPGVYTCKECKWRKLVHPQSDAIVNGFDHFGACPVCGGEVARKDLPKILEKFLEFLERGV